MSRVLKLWLVVIGTSLMLAAGDVCAVPGTRTEADIAALAAVKAAQAPAITSVEVAARGAAGLAGAVTRTTGGARTATEVIAAYWADRQIHAGPTFRMCHQYTVQRFSCGTFNTKDIISYWWPVVTVEIANYTENPYALNTMYETLNALYEDVHYPAANLYARQAPVRVGAPPGIGSGPALLLVPPGLKRLHGSMGAFAHVAYHVMPTMMQMAITKQPAWWKYSSFSSYYVWPTAIADYFASWLNVYCGVMHRMITPPEYFSDILPNDEASFDNAWSYRAFPLQMAQLRASPAFCVQRNLLRGESYGPTAGAVAGLASSVGVPATWRIFSDGVGIRPFSYHHCANNYGKAKPVTGFQNDRVSPAALAMQMFYKGIDMQYYDSAIYGFFSYMAFRVSSIDKLQWVDETGTGLGQCYPSVALPGYVGPGGVGISASDLHVPGERYGRRRVTLWKFFIRCSKDICWQK